MKRFVLTSTVAAIALLSANMAYATDYNSGIVTKTPTDGFTNVEFGSGWYLRGDIGIGISGDTDVSFNRAARAGDANADADTDYSASVGFGYIFNDFVRSDVTFDIFSGGSWSGSASGCGLDGGGLPFTGSCSSSDSGQFEAHAANINAYFNLGRWGSFSPYLGAGVGLAHIELTNTVSVASCVVDPGEACDLGAHSGAGPAAETFTAGAESFENSDSVNLAYSLMAGVDYRIDKNWSADINYRYTNITADEVISSGTTADTLSFDGVEIHEVRAGLRYDIW